MYNSRDHFWNEELLLGPRTRREHGGQTGPYYICVYGNSMSTYKHTAKNEDHSLFLDPGISESGYIDKDEVKLFYFTDQILMDPEIHVNFDGHVMAGAIELKGVLCPRPADMANL